MVIRAIRVDPVYLPFQRQSQGHLQGLVLCPFPAHALCLLPGLNSLVFLITKRSAFTVISPSWHSCLGARHSCIFLLLGYLLSHFIFVHLISPNIYFSVLGESHEVCIWWISPLVPACPVHGGLWKGKVQTKGLKGHVFLWQSVSSLLVWMSTVMYFVVVGPSRQVHGRTVLSF